jgi:hypothetical protein
LDEAHHIGWRAQERVRLFDGNRVLVDHRCFGAAQTHCGGKPERDEGEGKEQSEDKSSTGGALHGTANP